MADDVEAELMLAGKEYDKVGCIDYCIVCIVNNAIGCRD